MTIRHLSPRRLTNPPKGFTIEFVDGDTQDLNFSYAMIAQEVFNRMIKRKDVKTITWKT